MRREGRDSFYDLSKCRGNTALHTNSSADSVQHLGEGASLAMSFGESPEAKGTIGESCFREMNLVSSWLAGS